MYPIYEYPAATFIKKFFVILTYHNYRLDKQSTVVSTDEGMLLLHPARKWDQISALKSSFAISGKFTSFALEVLYSY